MAEIENLIKDYKEKYGSDEELEKMMNEYNINLNKPESNLDSNNNDTNIQKTNNSKNNITTTSKNRKRNVIKGPTPTINDAPIILPKIHRNYIRENRQLVMENKIGTKNKFIEEKIYENK